MLSRGNEQFSWSERRYPVKRWGVAHERKRRKKLLVPVLRGGAPFFIYNGGGEDRHEFPWLEVDVDLPRKVSPSKDSRVAFHAHFINSNLSSAENWIRLIPTIDARLRSRIQNGTSMRVMHDCIGAPGWKGMLDCFPSRLISRTIRKDSLRFQGWAWIIGQLSRGKFYKNAWKEGICVTQVLCYWIYVSMRLLFDNNTVTKLPTNASEFK